MDARQVSSYFLLGISFTYLCAFSSLYVQIQGLYGDKGLLPVSSAVQQCPKNSNLVDCIWRSEKPSLLQLSKTFGLSSADMMEFLALVGIVISSLSVVFPQLRDVFTYGLLWVLYFSCFQAGQIFLWFQWDTLLLETGFLAILVAPAKVLRCLFGFSWVPHDNITLFLVRWLLFRYIFASGVVKLTSECPTWWGLTALHWHFESQCIPTSPAWWAHQLPDWFKQLGVVGTFVIEIFVPVLFLVPIKNVRVFACLAQIFLQVLIIITGNYNFFNVTTFALCICLLTDVTKLSNFGSHKLHKRLGRWYAIGSSLLSGAIYGALFYWSFKLFGIKIDVENWVVHSEITFKTADLYRTLAWCVKYALIVGIAFFAFEAYSAIIRCFYDVRKGFLRLRQIVALLSCLVVLIASCYAFAISLVPISWLDRDAADFVPGWVKSLHAQSDRYQLTHSYGLFRSMTGVGGRPEIVIEFSNDNETWNEYEFLYKPGSLSRAPPFVAPHQPRLDWQMWFAALDSYQRSPWFISLVHRLLTAEKDVLKLIDQTKLPVSPGVPKYIRAELYLYHYTSLNPEDEHFSKTDWWYRDYQGPYFPTVDLESFKPFEKYLREAGKIRDKPIISKSELTIVLSSLREAAQKLPHHVFVWSSIAVTCLLSYSKRLLLK